MGSRVNSTMCIRTSRGVIGSDIREMKQKLRPLSRMIESTKNKTELQGGNALISRDINSALSLTMNNFNSQSSLART